MRKILTILFFFISLVGISQTVTPFDRSSPSVLVRDARVQGYLNLGIPIVFDTTLNGGLDSLALLIYNKSNSTVYYRDTNTVSGGHKWSAFTSGSSGTPTWQQTMDLLADINKLNYSHFSDFSNGIHYWFGDTTFFIGRVYIGHDAADYFTRYFQHDYSNFAQIYADTNSVIANAYSDSANSTVEIIPVHANLETERGDTINQTIQSSAVRIHYDSVAIEAKITDSVGAETGSHIRMYDGTLNVKGILDSAEGTAPNVISIGDDSLWHIYANSGGGGGDAWLLLGNAGTDPSINFLGTTDDKTLKFKVNNSIAGFIQNENSNANTAYGNGALLNDTTDDTGIGAGSYNSAFGDFALFSNTSGTASVGVGDYALYANTEGNNNVAVGEGANSTNTTGSFNVSMGAGALNSSVIGNRNTAIGFLSTYNNLGDLNTAVGDESLYSNTTGNNNTASGDSSLFSNTEGYSNVAVGTKALFSNTTQGNLVAVGDSALYNNTADANTAIGSKTLFANTTGDWNTALGYNALYSTTIGSNNTASGFQSLKFNTEGNDNIGVGVDALLDNTFGNGNIGLGNYSLFFNTIGNYNTSVGLYSLLTNITGNGNTAIGDSSLYTNDADFNTALGHSSLFSNTTGSTSIGIGHQSAFLNSTGHSNIAIGASSLYGNTTSSNLIAIGDSALFNNNISTKNVAIGSKSMYSNTFGESNTAVGFQTLYSNALTTNNTAIGDRALYNHVDGDLNTAIGAGALFTDSSGNNNVAVGNGALGANKSGASNTAVGSVALNANIGSSNTATGASALLSNTTGGNNAATGSLSLSNSTTGADNTAHGYKALFSNITGSRNTAIGNNADVATSSTNDAIALGYNSVAASNQLAIAPSVTKMLFANLETGTTPVKILGEDGSGNVKQYLIGTVASADSTGLTTADANVTQYNPTADGTFRIGGYITVTAVSANVLNLTVTYTDETGTPRTQTFAVMGTTSPSVGATGAFTFPDIQIRAKTGTSITVATTVTGVGSQTYNCGASIEKLR